MLQTLEIPIAQIDASDRKREDYGAVEELAKQIQMHGLIHAIAVQDMGDGSYKLLAGGRRLVACKALGWENIRATLFPSEMDPTQQRAIELVENIARKDLTWHEQCALEREINDLMIQTHGTKYSTAEDAEGWSQRMTAEMLGVSPARLSEHIRMADMIEVIPQLAECPNESSANKLLKELETDMVQEVLAEKLAEEEAVTPLDHTRRALCNSYIVKDVVEGLHGLPDDTFQLVEFDPPYGIYGTQDGAVADRKGWDPDSVEAVMRNYNEWKPEEFLDKITECLQECYRIMAKDSWLVLWLPIYPWYPHIYPICEAIGLQGMPIPGAWVKVNRPSEQDAVGFHEAHGHTGQTMSPECYLGSAIEYFLYFRKGGPRLNVMGKGNVFLCNIPPSTKRRHPTEKPVELYQAILHRFVPEGVQVCSPCLGSGNVILGAANLRMTCVGFDLSESNKSTFQVAVHEGQPGSYKTFAKEAQVDE